MDVFKKIVVAVLTVCRSYETLNCMIVYTAQLFCAGMPNAADMPMLLERSHNNGVELTWRALSANGSGPILYLVSSRSNVGRHFSDVDMTSWQVVTKVIN